MTSIWIVYYCTIYGVKNIISIEITLEDAKKAIAITKEFDGEIRKYNYIEAELSKNYAIDDKDGAIQLI